MIVFISHWCRVTITVDKEHKTIHYSIIHQIHRNMISFLSLRSLMIRLFVRHRLIREWIWSTILWLRMMSKYRGRLMLKRKKLGRQERINRAGSLFVDVLADLVISPILPYILISRQSTMELPHKAPSEDKVENPRKEVDLKWYNCLYTEKSTSNLWEVNREKWISKRTIRIGKSIATLNIWAVWRYRTCWRWGTSRFVLEVFCELGERFEEGSEYKNILITYKPRNNRFSGQHQRICGWECSIWLLVDILRSYQVC